MFHQKIFNVRCLGSDFPAAHALEDFLLSLWKQSDKGLKSSALSQKIISTASTILYPAEQTTSTVGLLGQRHSVRAASSCRLLTDNVQSLQTDTQRVFLVGSKMVR